MRPRQNRGREPEKHMKNQFEKVGQIHITGQHIDITDPCYDADVWCRTSIGNMAPGVYDCMVAYHEKVGGYRHVSCARIVLADGDKECLKQLDERIKRGRSWRYVGDIGVDAGIAGFFDGEKPDFSDSEWAEFCNWMREKDMEAKKQDGGREPLWYIRRLVHSGKDGFWTSSGYGDGGYSAYAIHSIIGGKRLTTAVEIRFL